MLTVMSRQHNEGKNDHFNKCIGYWVNHHIVTHEDLASLHQVPLTRK